MVLGIAFILLLSFINFNGISHGGKKEEDQSRILCSTHQDWQSGHKINQLMRDKTQPVSRQLAVSTLQ